MVVQGWSSPVLLFKRRHARYRRPKMSTRPLNSHLPSPPGKLSETLPLTPLASSQRSPSLCVGLSSAQVRSQISRMPLWVAIPPTRQLPDTHLDLLSDCMQPWSRHCCAFCPQTELGTHQAPNKFPLDHEDTGKDSGSPQGKGPEIRHSRK